MQQEEQRRKNMLLAYTLNIEFGYSKTKIAAFMGFSQQTIGSWIKEIGYQKQIFDLTQELNTVKSELHRIGYHEQRPLDNSIIDIN